ncbi:MAG: hypothetical protein M5U19_12255 [Microthrixaceae bacterium]|nr:hypothetical protein [Microthrixaceae bacterium]
MTAVVVATDPARTTVGAGPSWGVLAPGRLQAPPPCDRCGVAATNASGKVDKVALRAALAATETT